jgi:hypothetical protein
MWDISPMSRFGSATIVVVDERRWTYDTAGVIA